jgi:ATP-dependent RNA helicase RhlE
MGFINDVRKIIAALPTHRQTLLFSATMSPEVKALTAGIQKSPKMIQIGQQRNPIETITQHIYPVRKDQKMDLLQHMLAKEQMDCVLVFSRTKHGADKISHRLERAGIRSVAIHSNRSQSQRQRALDGFKAGKFQVMVATDIAARGIDVEGISHVINFDVPSFAEDYIHRIGRTGRAAATGDAITFVSREEEKHYRQIEKFIGRKLPMEKCPAFVGAKPEPMQQPKTKDMTHRPPQQQQPQQKRMDRTHQPQQQGHGGPSAGNKKNRGFQKWRRKGPKHGQARHGHA